MKERVRVFVANSSGCVQVMNGKALEEHLAAKSAKMPPFAQPAPKSLNDIITDPRGGSLEALFMNVFKEKSK